VSPFKVQTAIDTVIATLNPTEVVDLTSTGTQSKTFARLSENADPYWAQAVVAQLCS